MGIVAKSHFALVFLMLLGVGVSLSFPAEDVLDSVYDESESVPYEVTPLFSIMGSPVAAQEIQAPLSSLHLKFGGPSLFSPSPVRETEANRSAHARTSLALLCTLLC